MLTIQFVELKGNKRADGPISPLYLLEYIKKLQRKWLQLIHINFPAVRMKTRTWWHLISYARFFCLISPSPVCWFSPKGYYIMQDVSYDSTIKSPESQSCQNPKRYQYAISPQGRQRSLANCLAWQVTILVWVSISTMIERRLTQASDNICNPICEMNIIQHTECKQGEGNWG